jgi:hypothetical protein
MDGVSALENDASLNFDAFACKHIFFTQDMLASKHPGFA